MRGTILRFQGVITPSAKKEFVKLGETEKRQIEAILDAKGTISFLGVKWFHGNFHLKFLTIENYIFETPKDFLFPYLEDLSIWNCQLKQTRILAPNLRELDFYGSKLFNLSFLKEFKILRNLTVLNCDLSNSSNFFAISCLKNLKELNIKKCNLTSVPPLENLPQLERLHLSRNRIKSLKSMENVQNCESLREISLQHNEIVDLCGFEPLVHLKGLRVLRLNNNCINKFEITAHLPNLSSIYLVHNEISSVSGLWNLPSSKGFNFEYNKISSLLNIRSTKKVPHVRGLYFGNNHLKSLDFTTMENFPNIEEIEVPGNQITRIAELDALPRKAAVSGFNPDFINRDTFFGLKSQARSFGWVLDNFFDSKPGTLYFAGLVLVYKINGFIEIRLYAPRRVELFVNGKRFAQCRFLLLNVDITNVDIASEAKQIHSIDEAEKFFANRYPDQKEFEKYSRKIAAQISPKEIFWAHASNIQVWAEHDYDTKLLHRTLAFPLLRELTIAGDPIAKRVFKREIARRFENGDSTVRKFLKKGNYLSFFTKDELDAIYL
ncbi:MAG: hypothetical protein GF353_22740 [Candidatus Lokiarchaeota archaeon]|nr:hypothetical protein [Candidatus Lokiarchaeota archaeon]